MPSSRPAPGRPPAARPARRGTGARTSQCSVAAQPHRLVGEPVHLGQVERARPDPAEHDPAAGRAQVDRGDRPSTRRAHRRNAAATPASTGMCRPVVCDRSPPVSAKTALATCSGSTSRLSRVRWA